MKARKAAVTPTFRTRTTVAAIARLIPPRTKVEGIEKPIASGVDAAKAQSQADRSGLSHHSTTRASTTVATRKSTA